MKRKIFFFLISPLLMLVLNACDPDPVDTKGTITGIIKDAFTKANLQGAKVTLTPSGKSFTTGADGRYQFADVEMGDYKVAVTMADYVPDEQTATVRVGEVTNVDFNLKPSGPALRVEPTTLDFGENKTNLPITIYNDGQATLTWRITEDMTWVECEKTSGSVLPNHQEAINITVIRTGLSKGEYSNSISITSNGGPATVHINMTVRIDDELPTVSMIGANPTDVSAILIGTLTSVGSSAVTAHGFYWTKNPNESQDEIKTAIRKHDGSNTVSLGPADQPREKFDYTVSGLTANTNYYVYAYATNANGTAISSKKDFTTLSTQGPATVETGAATELTSNSVTVSGSVTNLGCVEGVTQHGHVWSDVSTEPTVDYKKTQMGELKQTGSFSSTLTKLKPNTLYYVRAYAINKYGISYGKVIQLTTLRAEVKLNTNSVTDIIHNEATCGGRITDLGGNTITERGVCWGTSVNPTVANSHSASTDNADKYSVRLTNLQQTTDYHVRAYAKTESGEVYYGQDVQFRTTQEINLPTLTAVSVSELTHKKATFTAKVSSLGNGTLKRSGFCYSTSHNPTVNNTTLSCGTAKDLNATTSSLSPETTYYVRAFAENEKGIAYSDEQSFTTKVKPEAGDINREEWGEDENWN